MPEPSKHAEDLIAAVLETAMQCASDYSQANEDAGEQAVSALREYIGTLER